MKQTRLAVALGLAVGVLGGRPAGAWDLHWIDLLGGTGTDNGLAVASDATGVYVAGAVTGALPGQVPAGGRDAYLRKYSFAGDILWTRQFGTSGFELAGSLAIHGGGIYVAGRTDGALPGQTNAGSSDAFVRRYTPDGDVMWTSQFGTDNHEGSVVVAVNDHGVFVGGETYGTFPGQPPGDGLAPFLARFDLDGGPPAWAHLLGPRAPVQPPNTNPVGVAVDDTGVYVVANVIGTMPFRKFDFAGDLVWSRDVDDVGECFLYGFSVSAHGGRVSVIGQADKGFFEDLSACHPTGVIIGGLRTFTADGDLLWQRAVEAGPVTGEGPFTGGKVVLVAATGVYVASNTTTTFAGFLPRTPRPDYSECSGLGDTFADSLDAYVRRYDHDGNVVWTHQFGGGVFDLVIGLGIGPDAVYTAGDTSCSMEGQPYLGGFRDGFLVSFAIDPQTAAGKTHLIVGTLETLKGAGRLTRGDFDALVRHLAHAANAMVTGQTPRARRALETFLLAVNRTHLRGGLSDQEAADLTSAAQAVLKML